MGRLDGKVALISGGARGQGAAEARLFVAEGAKVMIGDVLDAEGKETAGSLGDSAGFTHLDVTDERSWQAAVAETEERFGPVTVLVNNAGVLSFGRIDQIELDEFERLMQINVNGVFLGIKTVVPSMRRSGQPCSIVNTSSTSGLQGLPFLGAYVASKWAVRGLTKTAAIDLGHFGIRVNSIHPGGIDTPMIAGTDGDAPFYRRLPVPRMGRAEEVARAVLFLASDEASYTTGAELAIDGGATCGDLGILDQGT
jgi:3alpha(or 20beta)-hydroxysteroid dehydrogenase